MHRRDASIEVLTQAIVRYAIDRVRMDPPPLDGPRTPAELRAAGRPDDHARRDRRARGAAGLRRRARPGLHLRRPPPVPVVRARRADRGVDPVRPRRRRVEHLRRVVAGGCAAPSSPRTRRCAGSPTWPGSPPTAGGVFVSGGTAGNLSALIAGPVRTGASDAGGAHDRDARADRRLGGRPLVGGPGGAGDGRRRGRVVPADERGRLHARRRCARDRRRARRRRPGAAVRHRRHRRHDERRRRSTTSPAPADVADRTRHVVPRRRRLRRGRARRAERARPASPASSAPTASSSTRTSGCSPRSTAAPCSTATRRSPAAAHTQHAEYLDVLHADDPADEPMERQRLRPPPVPPGPRPAVLVQPGDARHRRLRARPSRPRCASPARAPSWSTPPRTSSC